MANNESNKDLGSESSGKNINGKDEDKATKKTSDNKPRPSGKNKKYRPGKNKEISGKDGEGRTDGTPPADKKTPNPPETNAKGQKIWKEENGQRPLQLASHEKKLLALPAPSIFPLFQLTQLAATEDDFFKELMNIPVLALTVANLLTHPFDEVDFEQDFRDMYSANPSEIRARVESRTTHLYNSLHKLVILDVYDLIWLKNSNGRRFGRSRNPVTGELLDMEAESTPSFTGERSNKNQIYLGFGQADEKGRLYFNNKYQNALVTTGLTVLSSANNFEPNDIYVLSDCGQGVIATNYDPAKFRRDGVKNLMPYYCARLGDYDDPKLEIKPGDSNFVKRAKLALRLFNVLYSPVLSVEEKLEILKNEYGIRESNFIELRGKLTKMNFTLSFALDRIRAAEEKAEEEIRAARTEAEQEAQAEVKKAQQEAQAEIKKARQEAQAEAQKKIDLKDRKIEELEQEIERLKNK